MRVVRDFDQVYAGEPDPWAIGDADSDRYELYRRRILEHARRRGRVLDVGCGYGAFLARFEGEFSQLHGVELAGQAVARARLRFPSIDFSQGSADRLADAFADDPGQFDCIIYSDVINYLDERGKEESLRWIAEHLAPGGLAFIAAWSPGGRYLTPTELRRLIARQLVIEGEEVLDSGHALFLTRPRRRMVALTIDYETWQPVPVDRRMTGMPTSSAPRPSSWKPRTAAGAGSRSWQRWASTSGCAHTSRPWRGAWSSSGRMPWLAGTTCNCTCIRTGSQS